MINVDLSKLKEIISSDLRLAGNIIQAIINFLSRNSFSSDFSSDINNILEKYKEVQRISSEASKSIIDVINIIGGIEKGNINSIRGIIRDTNSNRPTKTNTRSSNKADNIEFLGDTTSDPEEKSSVDVKKESTTKDVKVENVSKTTKEVDKTTNIETVKSTDTSSTNQVSKTEETTKAVETNDLVTVADNILKVDSVDNSKTGANETKELSDEKSSFMDRIINWLKKAWSELRYKFKSKTKETQQIRSEFTNEINSVSDRNSQVYENYINTAFFKNMPEFEKTLKDLRIEDWQLIDDDTRSKYEKYDEDLLDLLNEFNNLGGNFALASDNIDEETRAKLNKLQNEIQTLSEERNKFINDTIEDVMKEIDSRGNKLNDEIKKLKEKYEQLLNEQNDANNEDTMPLVKMLENKVNNQDDKRFAEMQSLSAKISELEKKRDAYVTIKAEYMGQLKQINFSSKSATYSLSALEGFSYTETEISEYMENVYKNSGSELSYETWKAFNQDSCVEQFLIEKGNEWRIEKYGSLDFLSDKQKLFMEPDEIAMYNYLHKEVSVDAADDYLSFLKDELNRREGEANALEFLNGLKNNNVDYVRTAGEGVKNGLQNFLSGYYNLVFADYVVDVDDYENMYIIEALSSDDYKVGLDFTYSTASSIGNMLIPATLSTVVTALTKNNKIGGIVGNVVMSGSILGNTFDQSLEEGKSLDGAFKYAVFSTASESVTSLFLSGVGFSVIEQKFGLFGNVVNELTEEELQLFLDKGYKALVEGDTEAFNNIKEEMGETFAQTLVSTLVLNGYNKATSTVAGVVIKNKGDVKVIVPEKKHIWDGVNEIYDTRYNPETGSYEVTSRTQDIATKNVGSEISKSSKTPGAISNKNTSVNSDVSEAFRIDYDAKSNKYDFVSPDGKKVLDSVNDVQTGDIYVNPNVQKAMNDVKGIESDVNSKIASENKNNSNLSDIEMLDAIDKSSKARKSEFYKEDISSNSASQKAFDDVKQIQKDVNTGSKNKTADVTANNTQTEAQRLREVEALRLKDGEAFDVNKYDLDELETIRKNNPGVDLKIDADNNRIVASKNERYTYDVEFAEAKNSVKAKGAEAVQQIIDEVGEIDANKSFSDIAKETQKNSKTSNSRDVYSDSHAQQIMDEIANVREDIKNKGTEEAKKIFDDIANIDANKSFSDIAKEAQKNGKASNSRDVYSDSHVQQALEDLANIRKEVNAKFKNSSDSLSSKKTSSTMVNNFDNQVGIFENVGEVTSAGVLGASLLQGMNSDYTNISLRERFWAVNEFQNAFKTGANSNGELIELLSLGFDEAMYSGNKDALGIMKMLTGIKTLNPNLTIEVDANNGNYWSLDDSSVVIGSNNLESKNLDTVYHELGHCLFDSLMDGEVPENLSHAIDSAKYIYHDSPFSEFFTKTLKGLEYSTRVEANKAYENNLKQSLGISIDERVKTLSENYTSFFGHMNVDEINSVLNEYGMDFEDFLYNYSGSLIDLAHDLAIVEIRNEELAIQDKIFWAKYGAYASLSDMVDAVHSGSNYGINGEHIYKFYQHGETYYKQESNFQFHELIADFTSLKLTGSTEALNYVKGMFGDELYNILDSTYKKFIYND